MIDIHSHILPKIDDGSSSPEETNRILDLMYRQGITAVAATPHFYANWETPAQFLARREKAVARMIPSENPQPEIILGAEVAYFSGIGICEDLIPLQLGNTKLLLVEMPFADWSERMIKEICDMPQNLGLIPVLAHVNRYRGKRQFTKFQAKLAKAGVLFQCNGDIFQERFKRGWALKQLKDGYIHFLGSDCHNTDTRPPNLGLAADVITKKLGSQVLDRLNNEAAEFLLSAPDSQLSLSF